MNNKDKDPFLEKLETLINKMEKIKSDFENSDDNSWLGLISDTSNALEEFLNDEEKKVGEVQDDTKENV